MAHLRQGEDLIDHLIDRLGPNRAIALGAVGFPCITEQQTQAVLDLRDRAHRGTGLDELADLSFGKDRVEGQGAIAAASAPC